MTDRKVLPGCARVRTKCAEKTSVGLWGQSKDPRGLPCVGTAGPVVAGCYKWYQSRPSRFHGRVWARGADIGFMAHVGPEWSHGMSYVPTLDTQTWPRGEVPGLRLIDEDVDLLRGVDCDILAQGLIGLIEYSYQQGIPSFPEAHLERTPGLSVLGPEQFRDG